MATCGVCVSDFPLVLYPQPYAACLRPEGHDGEHVIRRADGAFFAWAPDYMMCADCPDDGSCDCDPIWHRRLGEREARKLLDVRI